MYSSRLSSSAAVERVWVGDSIVDPSIGHRSDPVLGADLVFTLVDGTCDVALQGPVTRRVVYPFRPDAQYIGVRFRAGVGSVCEDIALSELCDSAAPVHRLTGSNPRRIAERLVETPDLEDRGRLVHEEFQRSSLSRQAPSRLVALALERFRAGSPAVRVRALARELGVTERTLQRHFRTHLGISPKHAARLVRIERVIARLDLIGSEGDRSLVTIASDAGFFDQAHMANDISRVLGVTPTALVRERSAHAETTWAATPSK